MAGRYVLAPCTEMYDLLCMPAKLTDWRKTERCIPWITVIGLQWISTARMSAFEVRADIDKPGRHVA